MKKIEQEGFPTIFSQKKTVSVETITQSFDVIRIYLTDDGVQGIGEHLDQIDAILNAGPNDVVEVFCLGCPGGSADTITALLNALATTPAHTVCVIEGHNSSAATMPCMVTNETRVGMYASFMIHNVSGACGGHMTNTSEAARFYESHYNRFLEDVYCGFLSPQELTLVKNGREIYLNSEDIEGRLQNRAEALQEECECCKEEGTCPSPVEGIVAEKPQKKKKKTPKTE